MAKVTDFPMPKGRVPTNKEWNLISDWCDNNRPIEGLGITINDADGGGKQINATASGIAGGSQGPWAIFQSAPGKVSVSSDHPLLKSYTLDDIVSVVNIGNGFTINVGQVLYLDIEYTAGAITTVTLTGGNRWDEYSVPYKFTGGSSITDPDIVINSYFLLAYGATTDDDVAKNLPGPIITIGSSAVKVVRCCSAPLIIEYVNIGAGFIIPYPRACGSRNGPPA